MCGWDKCEKAQKAEAVEQIEASGLEAVEGSGVEVRNMQTEIQWGRDEA